MSNVSDRATIQTFVSGDSKPLTGQVLVKATYKETKTKDGTVVPAKPGFCVSVPPFNKAAVIASAEQLYPVILKGLNAARTDILRAAGEAGATSLEHDALSLEACIASILAAGYIAEPELRGWFASVKPQQEAWIRASVVLPEGQEGENKLAMLRDAMIGALVKAVCKQKGAKFPAALRGTFGRFVATLDADTLADSIGEQLVTFAAAEEEREAREEESLGGL